jgi:phosphate transport system permease protein
VARSVRIVDGVMAVVIRTGGIGVILAVLGIFVFILVQILPLFRGASVELLASHPAPKGDWVALLSDEWAEHPALVSRDGRLTFLDLAADRPIEVVELAPGAEVTAVRANPAAQQVCVGTADGKVLVAHVTYAATFEGDTRRITQEVRVDPPIQLAAAPDDASAAPTDGTSGAPWRVLDVDFGDGGSSKVVAALVERDGRQRVLAASVAQKVSLLGRGAAEVRFRADVTPLLRGTPTRVLASGKGDSFLVVTSSGEIDYFHAEGETFELRQRFTPFEGQSDPRILWADYVFGDVSLVLVGADFENVVWSLFAREGEAVRLWGRTKTFPALPGPPESFARSSRTKAFLLTSGHFASLRFSTTESVRWEEELPFTPALSAISGKGERILFFDRTGALHEYVLEDPHPEASFAAFFTRIWYEGADRPKFAWESTGGTDDFEPKLSMVPLIIGTLKGTFFAMLFALPIALAAAIYTSQFAHWRLRALVKPTMEIMASLPSVVLGFLAALWLAPLLETRVPSVLCILVLVPAMGLLLGWAWPKLPLSLRNRAGLFGELSLLFIGLLVSASVGWLLGPLLEQAVFVTTDPATGARIADFRVWWPAVTGADFQQRNSLVVGFMMGFAVIPILFTIAEDALSNVPQALRSGSLALGATRWQTAMRVVLPTASAGIFSALMVGLGRAVGETMIVLMATGNTPIMDFNIFSGMRTLSANIATELPEAPQNGTLYRALFLGAMLLFLMTFMVNTLAEILRQRLRLRFRTV